MAARPFRVEFTTDQQPTPGALTFLAESGDQAAFFAHRAMDTADTQIAITSITEA